MINLKAKNLEFLNKLIIAWTLYNFDYKFKGFIASIIQTYRVEMAEINMDRLFTNLLDEARWIDNLDYIKGVLLVKT